MLVYNNTFLSGRYNRKSIISSIREKLCDINGTIALNEFDLNLVLDEAIMNAMEHGNSWNPEKKIIIKIFQKENELQILIEDEGSGFNFNDLDSTELKWQPGEKLNIRGRGIFILKQLCDIEWINRGNVIKIALPLKESALK
ncbi:MAG TPA: ATP-binding protein [Spirochaetota bacterium]|nr:ATP-binding protein [Spirochaetota bacterium]HPJ35693.1 ATP-binding protein [Spirochaetota bacterium]